MHRLEGMVPLGIVQTVQHDNQGGFGGRSHRYTTPTSTVKPETRGISKSLRSVVDKGPAQPEVVPRRACGTVDSAGASAGLSGLYRGDFSRRKAASTADRMRYEGDQQKGWNAKT